MKMSRKNTVVNKIKSYMDPSMIIGVILIAVSVFMVGVGVFAKKETTGYNGNSGEGSFSTPTCGGYVCWNVTSDGAFWVEFDYNGPIAASSLGFNYGVWKDATISGCKVGTKFYVLATRLHYGIKAEQEWGKTNGSTAGAKGMLSIGEVYSRGQTLDGRQDGVQETLGNGGRIVPESTAYSEYYKVVDGVDFGYQHAVIEGHPYAAGSNLAWFCGDPDITPTPPTPTPTPPTTFTCSDPYLRGYGRTTTRIAVKNTSLGDGWTASGTRSGLPSDSGWTDGGGEYYTIAKPGDSIQFLHAVCMQDRYARKTSTQDSWTSAESHDTIYDIPAQSFKIEAIPDYYAFGNGINVVNSQSQNVTAYEGWYSSQGRAGVMVDSLKYGIQTLSPTPDNNEYDCDAIAQYANKDPYIKDANFHIPGFDSGSCNSASKTRSNTVGQTVTQYHTFDSMKVWEMYYHSASNNCGCETTSSSYTNYTASDYHGGTNGHIKDYYCVTNGTCCPGGVSCNCDQYGNNCGCCRSATQYRINDYPYMYHTMHKNYGEMTKTAKVYVPYNFETSTRSGIDSGDVIFQGSTVISSFSWEILKRSNNRTSSFAYATVTPSNTKVQMVEFILTPDVADNVSGSTTSTSDPCSYYGSGAVQCNIINENNGNQNPTGNYNGASNAASYTRLVPDNDEFVGYKYCVAVGIWPSDSHDYQGNELKNQYSYGFGGAMDAGDYWNISGASCRTIAKRPSFQVWNGSIYTQGEISTSISQKMTGKSGGEERGNNYHYDQTTLFGSWADYAIVTDDETVRGMSSGAVLGYNNWRYNLSGGGGINTSAAGNYSNLSPVTVSNNSTIGVGNINASTAINTNLERLYSRYRDKVQTLSKTQDEGNHGSAERIYTSSTGLQYVYYNGNTNISSLGIENYGSSRPNQTTRREGSNLIKTLGDGTNDNTLVIYINGDLTIDNNICLGTGCSNDPTRLRTYNSISTNASAKLPQVLIFANNVYVTQDVNRIDAWLIVPSGTIDTCKGFSIGNNLAARDAKQRYTQYGNCYKTLVVNGPVYANSIALKRTAGNNHGFAPDDGTNVLDRSIGSTGASTDADKGSVAPAEIFNLRADAYIWAYNQAERSSEAVVTYTRELAPRY